MTQTKGLGGTQKGRKEVTQTEMNPTIDMGRIVSVNKELNVGKVSLIAVYTPNVFCNLLTTKMVELTNYSFIVGADFNAEWEPVLDRSNATSSVDQGLATEGLKSLLHNMGLIDKWPLVNPSIKD